jgi:3-(3-hydroxy-phenyl)propionate hydroxylase
LTDTAPSQFEQALIEQRGAVLHIAAPGTELAQWLRHGGAKAAIVRPDRTVMYANKDLSTLCDMLPRSHSATAEPAILKMKAGE